MPYYRRAFVPGGTFFFTVVTAERQPILCDDSARAILHEAIAACARQRPFELVAMVLLPEHLHAIWTLPPGDGDFSARWASIKARFTHDYLANGGAERAVTDSNVRHRRRGVWQRKFWEHAIRDRQDLNHHLDYIHYNPVKHGHCACPHAWQWSTFSRWVDRGGYEPTWLCACDGDHVPPPTWDGVPSGDWD